MEELNLPKIGQKKTTVNQKSMININKKILTQNIDENFHNSATLLEQYRIKIDDYESEINQKNNSVLALQRNFESLSSLFKSEKSEHFRCKQELINIQTQLKQMKETNQKLLAIKDELNQSLKKSQENSLKYEDEQMKYDKLSEEFIKVKQEKNQYEIISEQKSYKVKEQEYQIKELSSIIKHYENQNKEQKSIQQEIDVLNQEKKDYEAKFKNAQKDCQQMQQKYKNIEIELNNKTKENQDLLNLKLQFMTVERQHQDDIQKLQNLNLNYQKTIQKLEEFRDSQSALLQIKIAGEEDRRNQAFDLKDKLKEESKKNKQIMENLNELKQNCVCDRYSELIKEYEKIRNGIGYNNGKIICIPEWDKINDQRQIEGLNQTVNLYEQEIDKHKSEIILNQELINQLQIQIKDMLKRQDQIKMEKQMLQKSLSEQSQNFQQEQNLQELSKYQNIMINELRDELDQCKSKQQEQSKKMQELTKKNNNISEDYEEILQEKDKLLQQKQDIEKDFWNYKSKNKENENYMSIEIQKLREKLEQSLNNSEQMNTNHQKMLQIIEQKEKSLKQSEIEYQIKLNELKQNNLKYEEKNIQIQEQKDQIQQMTLNLHEIQQQLNEMTQQYHESSIEIKNQIQQFNNLNKQLSEISKQKLQKEEKIQELQNIIEQISPERVQKLIDLIKKKEKELQNAVEKIENAQQAAMTNLMCPICLNTIDNCKTCAPCGHNFCEKCQQGYQKGCSECKKSSLVVYDNKSINGVVAKMAYIKQTLDSLKNIVLDTFIQ